VLWSRVIGGADSEAAGGLPPHDRAGQPVAVAADGGLLLAARTSTFSAGFADAWLLKLSSNGFIDMDPASGATSAALGGDLTALAMPGMPTAVTAQPLALTRSDLEPALLSTGAVSTRQAGLP
jgi:hypothetical protein